MKSAKNFINSRFSGLAYLVIILFISAGKSDAQSSGQTSSPFLGWNSYNCYGSNINDKLTWENLEAFIFEIPADDVVFIRYKAMIY